MLIGLTGRKQSGKDTFYQILSSEPANGQPVLRLSFADKMKESFAALFDIQLAEIEHWKNEWVDWAAIRYQAAAHKRFQMRELLQRYGTEAHREIFGNDFWVNMLFTERLVADLDRAMFVVTDVRFKNEAERIKELGGHIVKIEREDLDNVTDLHASEQPITNELIDLTLANPYPHMDLYRVAVLGAVATLKNVSK